MPLKLTKEQAKEAVQKLVDKYNRIVQSGMIKRYKEEDTKAEFIEPLFEALGWDIRNIESDNEVVREEKVSKGRVDYSFRINDIPKFFLEAKALNEDLDNVKFIEQSINYAWHKDCTWAVLTDFTKIKIFNAEWKMPTPSHAQFGQTLPCQLFSEKFDQLWLLSRESFERKLIDAEAEKWGKKAKKISVDKQLLTDLTRFRELLTKNVLKNNSSKNLSADELDEVVQRIIDRLIFIRTLEDKELEAPMLQSLIREDLNKRTYKKLNLVFRKIDDIYNSKLFAPHLCENLEIDDDVFEKIITGLFKTSDNAVHYDFSAIDADVLGNIYEQYLGHILKKTEKRAKLSEGKAHRKEQGIYYTPTYIVDYIVKNTVGELAKDKKFDLKNIKILDPACGSGSFLMKAFDYLVTLDKKRNGDLDQTKLDVTGDSATYGRKVEILKNNIFGADLDPKAVEIAQLNLLLKAAEKKHRLPTLQENIKVGNSLIDDTNVAGAKAFKWDEQFKSISDNGGFDVIIGNPPYVRIQTLEYESVEFFNSRYISATKNYDLYALFVERGFKLLKDGGILGFILPSKFFSADYGAGLRKFISENNSLSQVVDFKDFQVFEGATTYTCLLFLKKKKNNQFEYLELNYPDQLAQSRTLAPDIFKKSKQEPPQSISMWNFVNKETAPIMGKLALIESTLDVVADNIFQGIITGADKIFILVKKSDNLFYSMETKKEYRLEPQILHPLLKGSKHIRRYKTDATEKYVIFPYQIKENKAFALDEIDLKKNFPITYKYLEENKLALQKRDGGKMKGSMWYTFSRNQNLARFGEEKIMTPSIAKISSFTYDDKSDFFFVGSGGGGGGAYGITLKDKNNYLFILSILNSKLISYFMRNSSSKFSGGYFAFNRQYIKKIPIIPCSKQEKDKLSELSRRQLAANKKLSDFKNKQLDEKERLEREIMKLDFEIDQEIYRLYGITDQEKKIIEESLKG